MEIERKASHNACDAEYDQPSLLNRVEFLPHYTRHEDPLIQKRSSVAILRRTCERFEKRNTSYETSAQATTVSNFIYPTHLPSASSAQGTETRLRCTYWYPKPCFKSQDMMRGRLCVGEHYNCFINLPPGDNITSMASRVE